MLFSFLYVYVDQNLIISRHSMDTAFSLTIESYHVAHKVFLERAIGISRFHQANIFAYALSYNISRNFLKRNASALTFVESS